MQRVLIISICLLIISCSGGKQLTKSFNENKVPLTYLHDSKPNDNIKVANLVIEPIDSIILENQLSVKRRRFILVPLVLFNYLYRDFDVVLGQNVLSPTYEDFFLDSFKKESERVGKYTVTNNKQTENDFVLNLKIDKCDTKSRFNKTYTGIFMMVSYMSIHEETGEPSSTDITVKAELRQKGVIIHEKNYTLNRVQPYLNTDEKDRSDFVINMAESLSFSTKEVIETIILDINNSISNL